MEDDSRPIQRMASDCRDYFQRCFDRFNATGELRLEKLGLATKEYQQRFDAWASYIRVFASDDSSLDRRLRNHPSLQDRNIRWLGMLRRNLLHVSKLEIPKATELPSAPPRVDEMGDHAIADAPPSMFTTQFSGIIDSIIGLNELALSIKSASRSIVTALARRFAYQRPDLIRLDDYEEMALFTVDCLYPNASEDLRRQLAHSMTDRYAKLKYKSYCMGCHEGCTEQSTIQNTEAHALDGEQATDRPKSPLDDKNETNKELEQYENMQRLKFSAPASSVDTSQLSEIFKAAGSKIAPSRSLKSMTVHTSHFKEPPLPKFEPGKSYTNCQFCFRVINRAHVQETKSGALKWSDEGRRHYRNDLQPYVCLSKDCYETRPTYSSSATWLHHMTSKHSENWVRDIHSLGTESNGSVCPLCLCAHDCDSPSGDEDENETENSEDNGEYSSPPPPHSKRRLNPRKIGRKRARVSQHQYKARETTKSSSMASHIAGHLLSLMNISLSLMSGLDQAHCEEGTTGSIANTIASSARLSNTSYSYDESFTLSNSPLPAFGSPTLRPEPSVLNDGEPPDTDVQDWSVVLERQRHQESEDDTDSILHHFEAQQGITPTFIACYYCKLRKVTCDAGTPCTGCIRRAAEVQCEDLAEHICLRQQPTAIFSVINKMNITEILPRHVAANQTRFPIFFEPHKSHFPSLTLSLLDIEAALGKQHQLDTGTLDEDTIVQWASSHLQLDGNDLQSILDDILMYCIKNKESCILPHAKFDLPHKVFRVRCLYTVWSQSSFLWPVFPGSGLEQLPSRVHEGLKKVVANLIEGIEDNILSDLAKEAPRLLADELPFWVCIMEVILLYHDLIAKLSSQGLSQKAEGLMNYAVVLYHAHFNAERFPDLITKGIYLSDSAKTARHLQRKFLAEVQQQDRPSDNILIALLCCGLTSSHMSKPVKSLDSAPLAISSSKILYPQPLFAHRRSESIGLPSTASYPHPTPHEMQCESILGLDRRY
ncbi:hypothetical protein F5Y10DRAFT_249669 [Nemania abortiva]|nr:hypothetical protein F5Y10DRAFT_249669 [Nemania abortiva]